MIFEGKVWKFGDNISTDLMMPGPETHARPDLSDEEAAVYCMRAIRPEWTRQVGKGDIIVAGNNWGCGSSRPAARMLKALKISAVVSESMSRLFFRNSINAGLPVLVCKGVSGAFNEGDLARINIQTGEVINLSTGVTLQGEALPSDSPPLQILEAGGLDTFMLQRLSIRK